MVLNSESSGKDMLHDARVVLDSDVDGVEMSEEGAVNELGARNVDEGENLVVVLKDEEKKSNKLAVANNLP